MKPVRVTLLCVFGLGAVAAIVLPWHSGNDAPPLICCGISWSERGSTLRRVAESLANANGSLRSRINWAYPWRSKPLVKGGTCASNIPVADYFRVVHGWERNDWDRWWSEVEARRNRPTTSTNFLRRYGLAPWTPEDAIEQKFTNSAWAHFGYYCGSKSTSTNASPRAAPAGCRERRDRDSIDNRTTLARRA